MKLKINILSIILSLILSFIGVSRINAQSTPNTQPKLTNVIPPSPNAAALQKYGEIPVSAYTGVPNISIPLYTIKFHDISVPISVSYHASGIKVSEEASNVGLGWVLNAGGVITHNIIGNDDFLSSEPPNAYYFNVFNNLDIADGYSPYQGPIQPLGLLNLTDKNGVYSSTDISTNLSGGGGQLIEFEPDQYYYNVQGLSGKFLLRRNYQPILQSQEKVDITCNTDGTAWDMKTVDGFIYHFGQVEYSTGSNDQRTIHHASSIYLTQITSPTGNVVTFGYTPESPTYVQTVGSYSESRDAGVIPLGTAYLRYAPPSQSQATGTVFNTVHLAYIDYGTGRVVFNYSNNRTDIASDNELDAITVFTKDYSGNLSNTPLKTFNFGYSYVSGSNYPNPNVNSTGLNYSQRLQLNSITETGNYNGQSISNNPYVFTYNTSTALALPSKSSLARDHWGYYNGAWSNTSLIPAYTAVGSNPFDFYWGFPDASRNANGYFMQAFSLSDIQYPTGGSTHFDYEANDCDEQKSYVNDHSTTLFPFTILPGHGSPYRYDWLAPTWTAQTLDITDLYVPQISNNQGTNVTTTGASPGTITAYFRMASSGSTPIPIKPYDVYISIRDMSGNEVSTVYIPSTYSYISGGQSITQDLSGLAPGKYQLVPKVDLNTPFGAGLAGISFNISWYTQTNSSPDPSITYPTTYAPAGGLRIKRITDNDGINPPKIKRYIYHYNVGQNPEYSYGRRMSRPEYNYWEQSEDNIATTDPNTDTTVYSEHLIRVSDSDIPLNGSAKGMVVGYDQVTVNDGENGENGKTVYKYYNNPDVVPLYTQNGYAINYSYNNSLKIFPILPRRRPYNSNIPDPLNGALLEQTDYKNLNGQFIAVKDVSNTYTKNPGAENFIYGVQDHIQLHTNWLNGVPNTPNYDISQPKDRLLFTYSTMQSDWTYLSATDVKEYTSNDPTKYKETKTNYYYDNPKHFLPTREVTTNSKQEIITTTTAYPLDFTNLTNNDAIAPGIVNLNNNHMINIPVEKYTQKTAADGTNARITSSLLTAFPATGLPLPAAVYQLQSVSPLTNFSSYAASGTLNSSYKPVILYDNYDQTNGNLLQQHLNLDVNYAYQWGNNKNYPVAQCKNAAANEFYYEGFEENPVGITGAAHTGNKYVQGAYTVTWTAPNSRNYVISYFSSNSPGVWTYSGEQPYKGTSFTLPAGYSYDDIRIFPADAQLTTYTYDTSVGMTSTTDPKGETTYFEYDGQQRLMNIKDLNKNIIKNFAYNYAVQPTGGQAIYYSAAQAGVFQKQGCSGSASLGTNVLYTVNPGQYTSTISQAFADLQAKGDVSQYGQAYANTNGSCIVPLYYSDALSETFTTSCNIGYAAAPTIVNVPFGAYTSNISKDLANQAAQTYAQNYAKANPASCNPLPNTFTVINNTGISGFVLKFIGSNNVTFTAPSSGSSTFTVPTGSYTLIINPPPASGNYPNYKFFLGSRAPVIAPGLNISNPPVNIAPNGELTLSIQNP